MGEQSDHERLLASYPGLRRFAAVVGPGDVEPDDLVQEAYVRALRRGLDGIGDLDAYLRRTVVNLGANERRTWVRRQRALARHGAPADAVEASTFVDAGDLLALPADVRAVLWLVEVEAWSYAQAADLLGCSEGAARMRAARARRRLRLQIEEEG